MVHLLPLGIDCVFWVLYNISAIPTSSGGVAACSTLIKAGKDEFSPWSVWPELAAAQAHGVGAGAQARHSQEAQQLSHSHVPVSHAWGLARAQASLLQGEKKALKRRGVGGKTQPDPTAIPSVVSSFWSGFAGQFIWNLLFKCLFNCVVALVVPAGEITKTCSDKEAAFS